MHTSGIGDYLDEEAVEDFDGYLMAVPVHELAATEDYLKVLEGHPQLFEPGERFKYCNSGYVVLALLCERATGISFYDLVRARVLDPARCHANRVKSTKGGRPTRVAHAVPPKSAVFRRSRHSRGG